MELFLTGIGVTIAYFILDAIINPVGVLSTTIIRGIKFVGIAMIVIGAIQWITSDDTDNEESPVQNTTSLPYESEDDEIEVKSSLSSDENDVPSSNINTYTIPDYPNTTSSPSNDIEVTHRYPCRACKNTGDCPVCDGTGQTKTQRVWDSELGVYDNEYETCKTCGGSRSCFSCKGDGWLDDGEDF